MDGGGVEGGAISDRAVIGNDKVRGEERSDQKEEEGRETHGKHGAKGVKEGSGWAVDGQKITAGSIRR